jgi:hypothetical protein
LAHDRPLHPYVILAVAVVLPGMGHVLARVPGRGLTFAFFMLLLGWVSFHLTTPEHSVLGRYAGGFLIYAISILDAYKLARLRWERVRRGLAPDGG